jgi:hypothetical protein
MPNQTRIKRKAKAQSMANEHHASGPVICRPSLAQRCLRRCSHILPQSPGLLLSAVLSVLAAMAFACSSTKKATPTVVVATVNPSVRTATAAPRTATAQAPAAGGLSGTWSGQYSGAFQGTFTLIWQQAGSNLSGTITLAAPNLTLPITGTVDGGAIRFGTVGSAATTYSGSVSGNSMSGTYQTQTGNGTTAGGPWSATKAS